MRYLSLSIPKDWLLLQALCTVSSLCWKVLSLLPFCSSPWYLEPPSSHAGTLLPQARLLDHSLSTDWVWSHVRISLVPSLLLHGSPNTSNHVFIVCFPYWALSLMRARFWPFYSQHWVPKVWASALGPLKNTKMSVAHWFKFLTTFQDIDYLHTYIFNFLNIIYL